MCFREQSLSHGASQSAVITPLTELVYCVTVAFTMTERADEFHYDNATGHSTVLVRGFFFWGGGAKRHIT